jgi:hypothetical protein
METLLFTHMLMVKKGATIVGLYFSVILYHLSQFQKQPKQYNEAAFGLSSSWRAPLLS